MKTYKTVAEIAEWLRVSQQTVYRWTTEGQIPVIRIGPKSLRYDPDAVLAALQGQQPAAETQEASTCK